ncbi:MAG TPA: homocysteine S-methyltransferase [Anaerolineales bacterium]|nr:homocysteine S-methyltransferase [Anaerolineales bacterium]
MTDPLTTILAGHGRVVLDGALATELERRGAVLDDPLWSARVLLERPDLIRAVHLDYFRAGADCATTASYQATVPGLVAAGYSEAVALGVIARSVSIAREARDEFWGRGHGEVLFEGNSREFRRTRPGRAYPFIAGSVGPYGAYLADGSEYRGEYGLSEDELVDFHRPRMRALVEAGVDILACETIPCLIEARALARLLPEFPDMPAWISFSAKDGKHNSQGEPVAGCARFLDGVSQVVAVGINCTAPRFITSLVAEIKRETGKPVLVYPNSGEKFDPIARAWEGGGPEVSFAELAQEWSAAGVRIIGGCCRTTPEDIADLIELKK